MTGTMQRPGNSLFPHVLMTISAALVSTSFIVGEAIANQLDPLVLTLLRFMLASALLAPYIHLRYSLRVSMSLVIRCTIISSCLVVFFWCMFLALRYTTALNTSVIFAFVPAVSSVYGYLLVRERLRRSQFVALLLGIAGAVWVIFRGDPAVLLTMDWNKGDIIFVGGCFSMALYTPLIKRLYQGESMLQMTFWVLVTGSCWLLLLGGYKLVTLDWHGLTGSTVLGVVYLSLFTTIITFFLTQYCTPLIGATKAMAYSYLYPGLVLIIELLLGHGLPPWRIMPGVVVVLLAMVLLQRSSIHHSSEGKD